MLHIPHAHIKYKPNTIHPNKRLRNTGLHNHNTIHHCYTPPWRNSSRISVDNFRLVTIGCPTFPARVARRRQSQVLANRGVRGSYRGGGGGEKLGGGVIVQGRVCVSASGIRMSGGQGLRRSKWTTVRRRRTTANRGVRGSYRGGGGGGGEKLGAESLSEVGFASRRPGFARPGAGLEAIKVDYRAPSPRQCVLLAHDSGPADR